MLLLLSSTLPILLLLLIFLFQQQYNSRFVYGQNAGKFTGKFHIVKANLSQSTSLTTASLFGAIRNNTKVNISNYTGPLSFVIEVKGGGFKQTEFIYRGKSRFDRSAPYSLSFSDKGNYTPVPDLRIPGIKKVLARGYNSSHVYRTVNIVFRIINVRSPLAPVPVIINPAPSGRPSKVPSSKPNTRPSKIPSNKPSTRKSKEPSTKPSTRPSKLPSNKPSTRPNEIPSSKPSERPRTLQSSKPTTIHSKEPSSKPSTKPSKAPTSKLSLRPNIHSTISSIVPSANPSKVPLLITPVYSSESCDVPKFLTAWEYYPSKPYSNIAEAQGNFIGTDFFIFGGFENGFWSSTNKAFYYSTINENWTQVDDIPTFDNIGVSHMPTVAVGSKVYGCGGYLGHLGCHALGCDLQASDTCYVYTHLNPPGQQWSSNTLPPLPGKRAGGGMWYDTDKNSLIFATGISSHAKNTLDGKNVWELSLSNMAAGWISKADSPYGGNHVGSTSVTYGRVQRHYIMGGQNSSDEPYGNTKFLYEYIAASNTWTQKKNMTEAVGHITASTLPYKDCGILIMGGSRNGFYHTADIYYYSISDDTWTKIGQLPQALLTPVCSVLDDWLYCQSGNAFSEFSWKVMIGSTINPALLPAPSSMPSRKPSTSPMPSRLPSARPSKKPAAPTPPVTVTIPVCQDPIMTGAWESWMPALPVNLKISHGGIINGNDFIVFGGYEGQWWGSVTNKVYAFDLSNPSASWRTMDDMPIASGITHSTYVIVANQMYVCGGFLNSGQDIVENKCWLYTHTNAAGSQWSSTTIPSLPQVSAAGAILYNSQRNTLIYTAGVEKHAPGDGSSTFDHDEVYEVSLTSPSSGWQLKANRLPYKANRVSSVTVNYEGTTERQYVMGGQSGSNDGGGNKNNMYEYVVSNDTWIVRSSLSMPRSHFTSATIPYKTCGIIIANGAVNGGLTADISYYSIATDTWSNIGSLNQGLRTAVCDIYNDYLYCQTGLDGMPFSQRMQIGP